jgi:hypothetical protein
MLARNASANNGLLLMALLLPALRVLADLPGEGFFLKLADGRKAGLRPWREKANLWLNQPCAWSRSGPDSFPACGNLLLWRNME